MPQLVEDACVRIGRAGSGALVRDALATVERAALRHRKHGLKVPEARTVIANSRPGRPYSRKTVNRRIGVLCEAGALVRQGELLMPPLLDERVSPRGNPGAIDRAKAADGERNKVKCRAYRERKRAASATPRDTAAGQTCPPRAEKAPQIQAPTAATPQSTAFQDACIPQNGSQHPDAAGPSRRRDEMRPAPMRSVGAVGETSRGQDEAEMSPELLQALARLKERIADAPPAPAAAPRQAPTPREAPRVEPVPQAPAPARAMNLARPRKTGKPTSSEEWARLRREFPASAAISRRTMDRCGIGFARMRWACETTAALPPGRMDNWASYASRLCHGGLTLRQQGYSTMRQRQGDLVRIDGKGLRADGEGRACADLVHGVRSACARRAPPVITVSQDRARRARARNIPDSVPDASIAF